MDKKFKYLAASSLILILTTASAAGFLILKSKLPSEIATITNPEPPSSSQSTQEAKLKEIYEKEKSVTLNKNFVPRYSVFQDDTIGFKIAYPVGFNAVSTDSGVRIAPTSGKGEIILSVSNGTSDFKIITDGLNPKETDTLYTAADFIKSTYQSVDTTTYNKEELQKRFSQGNENLGKY